MFRLSSIFFAHIVGVLLFAATVSATTDPYVMGALGDSITVAFDSRSVGANPELSWSTGASSDVMSHLHRLQMQTGNTVTGYNVAKTGAKAADLYGQLANVQDRNPAYVTIAIGANDICRWNDVYGDQISTFERDVRLVITQLVERNADIRIVLSPIPDMYNLWQVAHTHQSCQQKWNLLNICPALLGSSRTELQRQAFVAKWQAANDSLQHIAEEFTANVRFNPELAHTSFVWEDISTIDCFHPSVQGQNLFAEKTWETSWFSELAGN